MCTAEITSIVNLNAQSQKINVLLMTHVHLKYVLNNLHIYQNVPQILIALTQQYAVFSRNAYLYQTLTPQSNYPLQCLE